MLDGDEAGRNAGVEIAKRLAHRVWVRVVDVAQGTQPDALAAKELQQLLRAL